MPPTGKRKQTTKSSGTVTGTISPKSADKEVQAKARALKRAEHVEARRAEAEKRKEAGNAHFHAGEYHEAIQEYESAIKVNGPSVPCLSNLAAAWLKLEDSTEVKNVLRETFALMRARNDDNDFAGPDDDSPLLWEKKLELESVSDSSDWNHGGNGIPCRFYNHDGCKHGNACNFSHALDHKSVRDRLGRNVCIYFVLGNCKFGGSVCVYAHDKTYLPTGRWWEKENKRFAIQYILNSLDPKEIPASMPYILGLIDNRFAWAAQGIKVEHLFEDLGAQSLKIFRGIIDIGLTTARIKPGRGGSSGGGRGGRHERAGGSQFDNEAEWDSWTEDSMDVNDYGFTEDEDMELLCQGIKTWDDDPWAIRDALYPP